MKIKLKKVLPLLLAACIFMTGCANEGKTEEVKEETPIDSTYDPEYPPVSEGEWQQKEFYSAAISTTENENTLQIYKDAGYNCLMMSTMASQESNISAAKICDEIGLYYVIPHKHSVTLHSIKMYNETSVRNAVYEFKDLKNMVGWDVWDEPGQINFGGSGHWDEDYDNEIASAKAGRMIEYLNKYDPNSVKFINFLPGNAGSDYRQYAEEFIKNSNQSVISFDSYPFDESDGLKDGDNWWIDLGFYRELSNKFNKPFWCWYQQCMADGFKPTDSEIRVLMNTALAYDVKCLISWMPDVASEGEKTNTFETTKVRNQEIMALGRYLFNKKSVNIYHTGLDKKYIDDYYIDELSTSDLIKSAADGLVISVFEDGKTKTKYLFVVNKDYKNKITGKIELKAEKNISKFDTATEKENSIGKSNSISFDIPAGCSEIYVLK